MREVKWSSSFQSWGLHTSDCPCEECERYWAGDAALAAKLEAEQVAEYLACQEQGEGLKEHEVWYTFLYANGWEHGNYCVKMASANLSRCAWMIWTGLEGSSIVGVHILRVDGVREDFVYYGAQGL